MLLPKRVKYRRVHRGRMTGKDVYKRQVLDLIRGKDAKYAEAVLKHTPKAASEPLLKSDFMKRQLTELLTGYDPVGAVWFDGVYIEGKYFITKRKKQFVK